MAVDTCAPLPHVGEETYHVSSPHLGASKIATYLKCPQMYYLTYVEKRPAPKSPHAAMGTCIHKVVQMAHEARWTPDHAGRAAQVLQDLWEGARETTADPDHPDMPGTLSKACDEWLPWYLAFVQRQTTIVTEEHWVLPCQDVTLEGTIDRVYRQDGAVVLSDVKSGKRKPSPADLSRDAQLSIYTWAVREMGLREDRAELVWLSTQEQLVTTRTDDFIAATLEQIVLPVARQIAAAGDDPAMYPANPDSKYGCNFCAHHQTCGIGRGSGQGE